MHASTGAVRLPGPMQVRDLLGDLLRREVALRPGPPLAVSEFTPASVASYVDDTLVVRALVVLDLPLSAYAGAASALVPPAAARTAVTESTLGPVIGARLDRLITEVAPLLAGADGPQLRPYAVHLAGSPVPADLRARTQVLGRRLDLRVDVAGYGAGRLALVLA
ncbi:hypothetical protein [Nocardioides dongkuii]|uniref:hypothetical protein n=1 Tax=Nocardioides dongkuii TaxID=2760089 RepID=UPI0015F96F89|nr:hypothetical protein [Nocardioides dongkuii]